MFTDRLYASVVTLRARHDGVVPATQGHHAHAAFLDLVRQVDEALAAALHRMPGRKPFTVGPVQGLPPAHRLPSSRRGGAGGGVGVSVRAGQAATLRFTFFGADLFGVFIRRFLEGEARPSIRLGPVDWLVEQVLTTPGSHPWAGYATWSALWENWRVAEVPRTIVLEFASPTGFNRTTSRVKQLTDPYPSPRQVFGGLARVWRAFSPGLDLPSDLDVYADETVGVARYRLETHMHEFRPGRRQIGATGTAAYELLDQTADEHRRAIHVLADLAFYAGVGYKTAQGMGQCRRIER